MLYTIYDIYIYIFFNVFCKEFQVYAVLRNSFDKEVDGVVIRCTFQEWNFEYTMRISSWGNFPLQLLWVR